MYTVFTPEMKPLKSWPAAPPPIFASVASITLTLCHFFDLFDLSHPHPQCRFSFSRVTRCRSCANPDWRWDRLRPLTSNTYFNPTSSHINHALGFLPVMFKGIYAQNIYIYEHVFSILCFCRYTSTEFMCVFNVTCFSLTCKRTIPDDWVD